MIDLEDEDFLPGEPTEKDFETAALLDAAQREVGSIEHEINSIRFEAKRRVDALLPQLEVAKKKRARLEERYRALQIRLGIDVLTDEDEETLHLD